MNHGRFPTAVVLALTAVVLLAGCGSSTHSSTKRFSVSGIALHFRYPSSFGEGKLTTVEKQAGTGAATQVFVGVDRSDLLGVLTFPGLKLTVTPKNLAKAEPQIDALLSQAAGHSLTSTPETVHGIPVLSFPPIALKVPGGNGMDRVYYAFVGRTGYELVCQYTAAHIGVIEAACRQMLATLST